MINFKNIIYISAFLIIFIFGSAMASQKGNTYKGLTFRSIQPLFLVHNKDKPVQSSANDKLELYQAGITIETPNESLIYILPTVEEYLSSENRSKYDIHEIKYIDDLLFWWDNKKVYYRKVLGLIKEGTLFRFKDMTFCNHLGLFGIPGYCDVEVEILEGDFKGLVIKDQFAKNFIEQYEVEQPKTIQVSHFNSETLRFEHYDTQFRNPQRRWKLDESRFRFAQ